MPCPVGLAWVLLGNSHLFPIAKPMPKGFYGMNVALCEIMLCYAKLNDLRKLRKQFSTYFLGGRCGGLAHR
jgi:hypothetical protein